MRIDWRFGSGLKWNQLLTYFYFFFLFLLPVCSFLPTLPYKISYIQSFAAEIGDFWLRPLEWPFTMQNQQQQVWLPTGSCLWAASGLSPSRQRWAQAHAPTTSAWLLLDFFFAVVFTSWGALTFMEEPEGFILPPFRKISLSPGVVMWLR